MTTFTLGTPEAGKIRVFLHLGIHKTGSTSIQVALYSERESLANKGILYPETARPIIAEFGHHMLAWIAIADPDRIPLFMTEKFQLNPDERRNLWQALYDEISLANCHTVVVSSEELDVLSDAELGYIMQGLGAYEVIPVLFVRNHCDFCESAFKTSIVYSHETSVISNFIKNQRTRLDFSNLIQYLETFDNVPEVRVVDYDMVSSTSDSVTAFSQVTGIPLVRRDFRENTSIPAHVAEIARFMNSVNGNHSFILDWIEGMRSKGFTERQRTARILNLQQRKDLDVAYEIELAKLVALGKLQQQSLSDFKSRSQLANVDVVPDVLSAIWMLQC